MMVIIPQCLPPQLLVDRDENNTGNLETYKKQATALHDISVLVLSVKENYNVY